MGHRKWVDRDGKELTEIVCIVSNVGSIIGEFDSWAHSLFMN